LEPPFAGIAARHVAMHTQKFAPGDPVVFCKVKHSNRPGPRAHHIDPAPKGESYAYVVDKFWVVVALLGNGRVLLRTRRGKEHVVEADNPSLRRASWWERLWYRDRFPNQKPEVRSQRPEAQS
jgi:hypothetical protein